MALILLVEDNTDMLMMLSQVLEWGGYQVIAARGGNEALDQLNRVNPLPDLIISDLSMPDLDGFALLETVRQSASWKKIPFIIMSAHSSLEERRRALMRGADDFLVKPFNLEDFQKILARWNPPSS